MQRVGVGFVRDGVSRMYIGWCLERWCRFGSHLMLMTSEGGVRIIISFRLRLSAVMAQLGAVVIVNCEWKRKLKVVIGFLGLCELRIIGILRGDRCWEKAHSVKTT
jgi:hypothetical protein